MHRKILSPEQLDLLPLLGDFSRVGFYLAGGTGIALYLGHRRSIDFDLFTGSPFRREKILHRLMRRELSVQNTLFEDAGQLDLLVADVKITFLYYPYNVQPVNRFEYGIKLPSLLDLAALKVFAIGRRAKWKDYVDLYFVLKDHYDLRLLAARAGELFAGLFNERLLREQLAYFEDIDYSERINYLPGFAVEDEVIKEFLLSEATRRIEK